VTPRVHSESSDLVQMAALTDALVRAGPREAAILATDRLAHALLLLSRRSRPAGDATQPTTAREALRLRGEAQALGRRLRRGPVRLAPLFTWRVRQLVDANEDALRAG
jgi:hypothetical protein